MITRTAWSLSDLELWSFLDFLSLALGTNWNKIQSCSAKSGLPVYNIFYCVENSWPLQRFEYRTLVEYKTDQIWWKKIKSNKNSAQKKEARKTKIFKRNLIWQSQKKKILINFWWYENVQISFTIFFLFLFSSANELG